MWSMSQTVVESCPGYWLCLEAPYSRLLICFIHNLMPRNHHHWRFELFLNFASLQVGEIPEEILKVKREIEAEFLGEEQTWGRGESNVSFILTYYSACIFKVNKYLSFLACAIVLLHQMLFRVCWHIIFFSHANCFFVAAWSQLVVIVVET